MTSKTKKPKPSNPLSTIKAKIKNNEIQINSNAVQKALDDFNWDSNDVKKCLLKLNDRVHSDDPNKNHFYKAEKHSKKPNTMMDYYKAKKIMKGEDVYTHFYIHPDSKKVVISSFKKLL